MLIPVSLYSEFQSNWPRGCGVFDLKHPKQTHKLSLFVFKIFEGIDLYYNEKKILKLLIRFSRSYQEKN